MKERTIEITNYCPNNCTYCSSNASKDGDLFLSIKQIENFLPDADYDRINISGGEPLAHPDFYKILQLCKSKINRTGFVSVYTNELDCIMYNASLKYGIRVEANLPTLGNTEKIHVLKVIEQGCESKKPDIHYSCNWDLCPTGCEDCKHDVLLPNGETASSPCTKDLPKTMKIDK